MPHRLLHTWAVLLLVPLLLLAGCGVLSRENSNDAYAATAASQAGPANFHLHIHAPKAVRDLLEQHMELQRYRTLPGLRRSEIERLLSTSDTDIRNLLGTLGYFSPAIQIELAIDDVPSAPTVDTTTANTATATSPLASATYTTAEPAPDALSDTTLPPTTTPPAAERITITITVDPGPPTTIHSATLAFIMPPQSSSSDSGDPSGQALRQTVQANWPLQAGQHFTQAAWSHAKSDSLRRLQERRYPLASLHNSNASIDTQAALATLSVAYATGPAYRFGPLRIQGGQRYDSAGLIRLARLPEGQEYSQNALLDAQQRLAASGYYDSVFLTLDTEAATPDTTSPATELTAPVIAQVREAPLKKWIYGLGISTDTGPRLSVDNIHNRTPLLGWRAVSKLQANRKNPQISTHLQALPGLDGWRWFFSGEAQRAELADYETNSIAIALGRTKSEDKIDRNYTLRYDYANPQGANAPPSSVSATMSYGWVGRYFNSMTTPTSGYGFAWETGAGLTFVPQRRPFARASVRWLSLHPVGQRDADTRRRSRIALRVQAGAVLAQTDTVIPLTQLFLTGGDLTVRGYGYHSIGTRTHGGQTRGGRYMVAGSIEWQRPITLAGNRSDWEHAIFADAGTVTDEPRNFTKVFAGIGTGIRWNSPVGPLQADLAYGLQTRQIRLHLRLGFNF